MTGNWIAALGSCLLLGLKHGFDYDHLAAISDITAVQRNWKSGLRLGMTYALGHAFMVAALGVMVLELHLGLPAGPGSLDGAADRADADRAGIGRGGRHPAQGCAWTSPHARGEPAGHRDQRVAVGGVADPAALGSAGAQAGAVPVDVYRQVGLPHRGFARDRGARHPASLGLFFLTANLGGTSRGLLGLTAFALGLVAMNGLMTATLGGAFNSRRASSRGSTT